MRFNKRKFKKNIEEFKDNEDDSENVQIMTKMLNDKLNTIEPMRLTGGEIKKKFKI